MHWLAYPVLVFVVLVLLMQYLVARRARQIEGRSAPDTGALDGEAHGDSRRVYYFYSAHCGPCRASTPIVDRVRQAHRNLIKVDVARHVDLARAFGIAATPSFIAVEDGVITKVRLGGLSEAQILGLLE